TRLATESATPSTTPRYKRLPSSTVSRKLGRSGKIISLAMSFSRLARPRTLTLAGRAGRVRAARTGVVLLMRGNRLLGTHGRCQQGIGGSRHAIAGVHPENSGKNQLAPASIE